jgi:hypothetical protein
VFAEYRALGQDPRAVGGAQLQPIETATTVRVQDGQSLTTDGPYADTNEVFGAYYVFEVDNLDEAIELAARIPAVRLGARSRSGRWWSASPRPCTSPRAPVRR